jgi:hypothetical protein
LTWPCNNEMQRIGSQGAQRPHGLAVAKHRARKTWYRDIGRIKKAIVGLERKNAKTVG